MCGIVGYVGCQQAQPIILNALKRLDYHGYDSSGIAVRGSSITTFKDKLSIEELAESIPALPGTSAIGHTRWATCGNPSQLNAHPHLDCTGRIAVVHNGVISNYQALRDRLIKEGHVFTSETDSEVIPHLIEQYYDGNIEKATSSAMSELEGFYAFAVLAEMEDKIVAAKNGSPLAIGLGEYENIIASDIPAVLDSTDQVIYLEDGDVAAVTPGGIKITNGGLLIQRQVSDIAPKLSDLQTALTDQQW
jgi:glutamine---fructose-6-phosphate transaminase (isomerizing)